VRRLIMSTALALVMAAISVVALAGPAEACVYPFPC
jgi:hypothetical protein